MDDANIVYIKHGGKPVKNPLDKFRNKSEGGTDMVSEEYDRLVVEMKSMLDDDLGPRTA